jgi:hypothetical protein
MIEADDAVGFETGRTSIRGDAIGPVRVAESEACASRSFSAGHSLAEKGSGLRPGEGR